MKPLIISSVFFIISFILFSNCSQDNNPVVTPSEKSENATLEKKKKKWPEVIYDSIYGEIVMDYSVITPTAAPCGFKQTYGWGFDHYEPKSGKTLGIYANHTTGPEQWTEYRTKWGFTQELFVNTAYGEMGGYSKANCLVTIPNYSTYQEKVLQNDSCNYFIDEPIERGSFSISRLVEVSNFINQHRPGSKLHLSSWWCTPYFSPWYDYITVLNQTSNTFIANDRYGGCGSWDNEGDQRSTWTYWRNAVVERNPTNWIHTDHDKNEFSQLIGHANNLGINSLWFFIGDAGGHPANAPSFSYAAWRSGWLRKFEQYFRIEWRCTLQDPCDCDPTDPDAGWYIYKIWPTGSFREVFP